MASGRREVESRCLTFNLRHGLLMALVAVFPSLAVAPASAQQVKCAPRDAVLERLGTRYSEAPVGVGVTQQGALVEVLASDGGTWSIVISTPDGLSWIEPAQSDSGRTLKFSSRRLRRSMTPVYSSSDIESIAGPENPCLRMSSAFLDAS